MGECFFLLPLFPLCTCLSTIDTFGDHQHSRLAYLDDFIHSLTQPSFISSSAPCAGVAAVAGEVATDEKYLMTMERSRSGLILLVLEMSVTFLP